MINAYCTDTLTLITRTKGTWGSATETQIPVRGRFEFKTEMVRNMVGEMVVATAKVYIPWCSLTWGDIIVYGARRYNILTIEEVKDFSRKFLKLGVA